MTKFTALNSGSFMEVVKEVAKQGSAAHDGVAIRANEKSYTYKQLISAASRISTLLCGSDLNAVSSEFYFCDSSQIFLGGKKKRYHLFFTDDLLA